MIYENQFYNPISKNWYNGDEVVNNKIRGLNINNYDNLGIVYLNWCKGAVGIGIQRLRFYNITRYHFTLDDYHKALDSLLFYGYKNDNCLCHGNFGNIELLADAGRFENQKYLNWQCK